MGYGELVKALDEENERQQREKVAAAESTALEIVEAGKRELAAARLAALAAEGRRLTAAAAGIDARLRLEVERASLVEMRRALAELIAEAERRLPAMLDETVAVRLAGELLGELDGGSPGDFLAGWKLLVDPPFVDAVQRRAGAIPVAGAQVGGAIAVCGGRTLDNRLVSRLRRAWPELEGEVARLLFEAAP